jgi:hypothetical protein
MECYVQNEVGGNQTAVCRMSTIRDTTSSPMALTAMLDTINGLASIIFGDESPDNLMTDLKNIEKLNSTEFSFKDPQYCA